ncbi:MAG TPA: hypothetical protein VFR23_17845 [Jiangellaceae bacterium]|nr:hypothetical protein [Jiangellaceae bacterium]
MPRTGPRRENVIFRMSSAWIDAVEQRAEQEELRKSEILRLAVIYYLSKAPKGWRP